MAGEGAARNGRKPRVGDALTLFVFGEPAARFERWASGTNLPPAALKVGEALLAALVFVLFWKGWYWIGLLAAVPAMVAGGGIPAQLYAAFWWWAWTHGLAAWGRPLEPVYATMVLWVVTGGAVSILVIEQLALHRTKVALHAWRPFDTRFKLVGASRNTNLVILAAGLLVGRPDSGLVAVAWWTLISLIVHAVRFAQMTEADSRREPVRSWLDDD